MNAKKHKKLSLHGQCALYYMAISLNHAYKKQDFAYLEDRLAMVNESIECLVTFCEVLQIALAILAGQKYPIFEGLDKLLNLLVNDKNLFQACEVCLIVLTDDRTIPLNKITDFLLQQRQSELN